MTLREEPGRARGFAALWLLVGIVAVAGVSIPGVAATALSGIATPPALVRAFLAGLAVVGGLALLRRALLLINETRASDLATMVRGVRFVFLAAASLAAAAGWLLGDPLPIVVALVITGVDLAETSFLLLVASGRQGHG